MARQRNTVSMFSPVLAICAVNAECRLIRAKSDDDFECIMQNKANFRKAETSVYLFATLDYEKTVACRVYKNKAKQSQSFDFAQDRSSDNPCVSELAGYNLVLRDGNIRDFNREYVKCQMHPRQMQ